MNNQNIANILKKLAENAVNQFVLHEKVIVYIPSHPYLKKAAPCFVCLKKEGRLRGCVGTIKPTKRDLASEVIKNAISAATEDFRFSAVKKDELGAIRYSVDVLSKMVPIASINELNPKRYGVLLKHGLTSGLLLPDLEGVETIEQQLKIAKEKAGILDSDNYETFKFEVERF